MTLLRELIFDMLSYLPVKSLLRFKCVCKHWNDITQDFQFICLHSKHAPLIIGKKLTQTESNATIGEDEFKHLYWTNLQLEYTRPRNLSSSFNFRYHIRNPGMQHQILDIPDSESIIVNMRIMFDPDYQVLKLLSLVYYLIGDQLAIGYEVLDLRNEESGYSWRPLNSPTRICSTPLEKYTNHIKLFIGKMGTAYSMWNTTTANSGIEIDILDMVNDSYIGHTTLPTSFYTKNDSIPWNGKLSFAKIVKDEIHVMVLDYDNKKQIKWADGKLIVKLPFLKELSAVQEQIKLIVVRESKLWFWWKDKDKEPLCCYDIKTGKLRTSGQSREFFKSIRRPCLVSFKGTNAGVTSSQ